VRQLRALLPARTLICFAIKANPLAGASAGKAASSGLTAPTSVPAANCSAHWLRASSGAQLGFTGPGKTDDELGAAVRAGVRLCAESIGEIGRIGDAAGREGRPARVALRINPDFHVAGTRVRMNEDSVFGIDDAQIPGRAVAAARAGDSNSAASTFTVRHAC
jgi:diaminopimelate decarboxylase